MEVPEKTKNRTILRPSNCTTSIYPQDTGVLFRRDTCTPMFIAALSTIAEVWKEPKCPSMDEWIKKMWSMYTMEYYSALEKKKKKEETTNTQHLLRRGWTWRVLC